MNIGNNPRGTEDVAQSMDKKRRDVTPPHARQHFGQIPERCLLTILGKPDAELRYRFPLGRISAILCESVYAGCVVLLEPYCLGGGVRLYCLILYKRAL